MSETLSPAPQASCDREPIHTPGSIQPHGLMLVVDRRSLAVLHVAGDIEGRLDVPAWHGTSLAVLIGDDLCDTMRERARSDTPGGYVGQMTVPSGETLDVSMQVSGSAIIIELEATSIEVESASLVIDRLASLAAGLESATTLALLYDRAAVAFRTLTGFARVMVYRFLDDGAGTVVAEDRRPGLKSFLNHHFPASDIPMQARALYVRNPLRVIPDIAYTALPLRPDWDAQTPLDMSDSSLRSVSPVHLLYLANMGVKASASFSIIKDGALWGLIACHNDTPLGITYDTRAACRLLVDNLARQIKAMHEAEGLRQHLRLRSFEDDVAGVLSSDAALEADLPGWLADIRRMMDSDGIAILRGTELVSGGACPTDTAIMALAGWLSRRTHEPVFASSHLQAVYPPAKGFAQTSSGLLAITLSASEPWLVMWFRAELVEVVEWAGNPHKAERLNATMPLTPRASFEAWTETVRGRGRPWSMPEVAAAGRLRGAMLDARQNQRVIELNRQLTRLLQDKDILLQQKEFLVGEVNHRVQNSLTLVSSFLGLQAKSSNNPDVQIALEQARRRLTAVALVHRRLYRGDHIEMVNCARYIEELCADTFAFMGGDWASHLTLQLSPVPISTDRAVTLGLVLTELLINANKHAYGGEAGPIDITLTDDRTQFRLIITDKGVGHTSGKDGFGSKVLDGLVKQLAGTLTRTSNQPGLRVTLQVPTTEPLAR